MHTNVVLSLVATPLVKYNGRCLFDEINLRSYTKIYKYPLCILFDELPGNISTLFYDIMTLSGFKIIHKKKKTTTTHWCYFILNTKSSTFAHGYTTRKILRSLDEITLAYTAFIKILSQVSSVKSVLSIHPKATMKCGP